MQDSFKDLSPKSREIFLDLMIHNPKLAEIHKNQVDPNFDLKSISTSRLNMYSSTYFNELTILQKELSFLTNVAPNTYYSLLSFASSIVASISDGIALYGDALLALSVILVAGSVILEWNKVSHYWAKIKSSFF